MIVLSSIPATGEASPTPSDALAGPTPLPNEWSIERSISGTKRARDLAAVADQDSNVFSTGTNVPGPDETCRLIYATAEAMGFEWLSYSRLKRVGDQFQMRDIFKAYASPQWVNDYLETRYFEVDPRIQIACRQEVPLVWDLQLLTDARLVNPSNRRAKDFLEAADAAGVRSGVVFGIPDPNSVDNAILSFYSSKASRIWIGDSIVGQCYALGTKLHSLLNHATEPAQHNARSVELSDIQRHILKLIINGLSSREIGEALATSVQNVDYHIRELRRKFGARNRVQLAYAASRLMIGQREHDHESA